MKAIITSALFLLFISICAAQELVLYKQVDTAKLYLELRYPDNFDREKTYPAMVFFFGGGWNGGNRNQFYEQANYFAKRGIVCFLADYRTKKSDGVSPFECVKDAKSAVRFIRKNAEKFSIDPSKLIASGGSAGGHLAAATGMIELYNEETDDLAVSCVPNALVLFNPVIDNGPAGYGFERIGEAYKDFSPLHNVQKGDPPTIFFFGTVDYTTTLESMKYFEMVMNKVGSQCKLKLYEGEKHGFFNYKNLALFKDTVWEADQFLSSLGFIKAVPSGDPYFKE
ncbi:alpha/beta hydrolase [Portibacter lacus]|uniref:Lipase n=1 Tax=Portibacter lacus TaxID=1099794 RepID=A0AA37SU74_9BACT|nr:alpha/beta hydrolase [Portibacter lacus]GLR18273.1 lipase [Portibacter lacus]